MFHRLVVPCLVLALAETGCHRRSGPDANYEQASKLYQQLYASQLDDAYGDPRMDQVEALLRKVDPGSVDAPAAKTLLDLIHDGREALAKQRADREKLGQEVAKSVRSAPAFGPSTFASPADAGSGDPYGDGASVAQINKDTGGCLVPNEPFGESGTGMKGTIYRLAGSSQCSSKLAGFVGQAVLVVNGSIYRRMPDFAQGQAPDAGAGDGGAGASAAPAPGGAARPAAGPATLPAPAPAQAPPASPPAAAPESAAPGTTPGFQQPAPAPESAPEPAR